MHYALYNTCVALCIVFKCLFRHRSALEYTRSTCVALCIVSKCLFRQRSALEYTSTTSAPLNGNSRSLWALMSSIVENDHRERSKRRIYISTKTESCNFLTKVGSLVTGCLQLVIARPNQNNDGREDILMLLVAEEVKRT